LSNTDLSFSKNNYIDSDNRSRGIADCELRQEKTLESTEPNREMEAIQDPPIILKLRDGTCFYHRRPALRFYAEGMEDIRENRANVGFTFR
jgi:hypothetical protein